MLGLMVLAVVVVLWVGSSELIKAIFNTDFNRAFFLTYFSTSLFALYLPMYMLTKMCRRRRAARRGTVLPEEIGWRETLVVSAKLCPVWFIMNFLFNWSLEKTGVASNTILSNTSGLWVVVLSVVWLREPMQLFNLAGVLFTVAGAVCVALDDTSGGGGVDSGGGDSAGGNIAALCSAIMYAVYSLLLDKMVDEQRTSMMLLFGLIGSLNVVLLWPFLFVLDALHVEELLPVPSKILLMLFINGIAGTVISDLLWAKAVILTSPLVCTVGLTLTIPLAMVADLVLYSKHFGAVYILGSCLVFVGFVLVNWKFTQTTASPDYTEIQTQEDSAGSSDCDGSGLNNAVSISSDEIA